MIIPQKQKKQPKKAASYSRGKYVRNFSFPARLLLLVEQVF